MTPETKARLLIDGKLEAAGWVVQDMKQLNLGAGPGVAVREYPTDTGPADYILFVDRSPVGVIEAKRDEAGANLSAHEGQTERYANATLKWRTGSTPLRFLYESTGQIIWFTDGADPVVLPDNVLFEGGAGEKIRRKLLETCDVHTLLRLPTGIFYAQGVKANVLFFDAKQQDGKVQTKGVWIYDLRTNKHFTLKTRPLRREDLQEFIEAYNPANRHKRKESERFRYFAYKDLIARDKASLDIFWLKDDSLDDLENLPPPDVLAQEIIDHLEAALTSFRDVAASLPRSAT